jgi:hypothetical protein
VRTRWPLQENEKHTKALCNKKMKGFSIIIICFILQSCVDDEHLRGAVEASKDGKTYFGVIDNNGGQCGPLLLDGELWPKAIGDVAPIEPGYHEIHWGKAN